MLTTAAFSCPAADGPRRGQQVLFAQSIVSHTANGDWLLTVHGRIYEPPERSRGRQMLIDMLAGKIGAARDDALFRSRAGYLVSDSNRNMRLSIALGERIEALSLSDPAGYVSAELAMTSAEVARLARDGVLSFESLATARNPTRYRGAARVVPAQGMTVVTDMDDTIKDTNIRNAAEAKANTFLRPFRPVAGMPERYRAWQAAGGANIHFHVVSAGPWQFHEPLRRFTEEAGFPDFTWDMRAVDVMNPAILIDETVKADPQRLYEFKVRAIRALITRLPQRRYVLVGDSGEKDPEVYATILAQFPQRIAAVYIRDVTGESRDAPRYQTLYAQPAANAKLTVFMRPEQLPDRLEFESPK